MVEDHEDSEDRNLCITLGSTSRRNVSLPFSFSFPGFASAGGRRLGKLLVSTGRLRQASGTITGLGADGKIGWPIGGPAC